MKKFSILIFTVVAMALLACGPSKETKELMANAKQLFGPIPDKMPGSENDSPNLIKLGKKLYFEKALSINDTQSCSSCHLLGAGKAGVDNLQFSLGAKGQPGGRNAPTSINAGFHIAQFWDGRAKDLAEQAKGPILNPVEMAMPNEKAVIAKISKMKEYQNLFKAAFPKDANPITYDNLAEAIAAFERTLITTDRFDAFQKGDHTALSKAEQQGLKDFMDTGCTACHAGPLLGGNQYRKMGLVKPYANTKDKGRYEVTKNKEDMYIFKVPSLRNVAKTAPYFHDGAAATLEEAVKTMASLQLGKDLSDEKVRSIVTFLNTLTGTNLNSFGQ